MAKQNFMSTITRPVTPGGDILTQAGLNWKVVRVPVQAVGRTQNVTIPERVALWRSDRGDDTGFLSLATDSYVPHQNKEIVDGALTILESAGATIDRLGSADNGRLIAGSAILRDIPPVEARRGDIIEARLNFVSGHEPGQATKFVAAAIRKLCDNGATVNINLGAVAIAHLRKLSRSDFEQIQAMVAALALEMRFVAEYSRELDAVRFRQHQLDNLMYESAYPEDAKGLLEHMISLEEYRKGERSLLDDVVTRTEERRKRLTGYKHRLNVFAHQPGLADNPTAFDAFNALTYIIDHPNSEASAVRSAGPAAVKERAEALELVREYAKWGVA